MDDALRRALAAAARAFADELERDAADGPPTTGLVSGTRASMLHVLRSVARINDDTRRGADEDEMRAIARQAGMDPRGLAGYHAAHLIERREDGSWLRPEGRDRLARLIALSGARIVGAGLHDAAGPHPSAPPGRPGTPGVAQRRGEMGAGTDG